MLPTFIVVEAEPIIRQDLAEIIATCPGGATVADFETAAEALAWLDHASRVDLVFIGNLRDRLNRGLLTDRVTQLGAIAVDVGGAPRKSGTPDRTMTLDVPFTNSSVAAFVEQWQQQAMPCA